jgi:hypothetical protein
MAVAILAEARLEKGAEQYGDDSYRHKDVLAELQEELLDGINYLYLMWLKVQEWRERYYEACQDVEDPDYFKVGGTD